MEYKEFGGRSRTGPATIIGAVLLLGCVGVSWLAYSTGRAQRAEITELRAEVLTLSQRLQRLDGRSNTIAGRLATTEERLRQTDAGIASLAARVLQSVFTVQTRSGQGAGFVAWIDDERLYVVTADHVVADAGGQVTLERKEGSWSAEVVGHDPGNDLAVLRVSGRPVGARPLWQRVTVNRPRPGAELLLIGSPYGLAGTVTTGVVSRVAPTLIQTDAAANPGSSGGPAVDRQGRVVGVLVAGGGENLNFAVPIQRVCISLRDC